MKRRDFIKLAGAGAALFPLTPSVFSQQTGLSRWNSYRLTYKVIFLAQGKERVYGCRYRIPTILPISFPKAAYGAVMRK